MQFGRFSLKEPYLCTYGHKCLCIDYAENRLAMVTKSATPWTHILKVKTCCVIALINVLITGQ